MNRHQFIECLIRIAEEKYVKQEKTSSLSNAVERIMEEHCLQDANKHDTQQWREKWLWNENTDKVYKHYKVRKIARWC